MAGMRPKGGQFRGIYSRLWNDQDFIPLSPKAKLVYVYLRTGPHSNFAALFRAPWDEIFDILGLARKEGHLALEELSIKPWILIEPGIAGDLVMLCGAVRQDPHMTLANWKHLTALASAIADIPKTSVLRGRFLQEYPEVVPYMDAQTQSSPEPPETETPTDAPTPPGLPTLSPTAADVQREFAKLYFAKTQERYFCNSFAADMKTAKRLLRQFSYAEVVKRLGQAFSGEYMTGMPGNLGQFARDWPRYVDANKLRRPGGDATSARPPGPRTQARALGETEVEDLLDAYVGAHKNLIKFEFDQWWEKRDMVPEGKVLWSYFQKHFTAAQKLYRESLRNAGPDTLAEEVKKLAEKQRMTPKPGEKGRKT